MTKVMLQPVLRQVVALEFDSSGKTWGTTLIAMIAYIHPRRARPKLIARTTDFNVMIKIGEVRVAAPGSEG